MNRMLLLASAMLALLGGTARAEDGYDLWLRYPRVSEPALLAEYRAAATQIVVAGDSPTLGAARDELVRGLTGLLGAAPPRSASIALARRSERLIASCEASVRRADPPSACSARSASSRGEADRGRTGTSRAR